MKRPFRRVLSDTKYLNKETTTTYSSLYGDLAKGTQPVGIGTRGKNRKTMSELEAPAYQRVAEKQKGFAM